MDRSAVKISPRRESQLMAIKHFHKGFPVWVENVYEEKSSQYRASLLPQNYCTRPTWIPATVYSVDNANRTVEVRTTFSPSKTVHLTTDKIWARNNTRKPLEDMVYFHHLHEPAIVNNIMVRYLSQQIYTRASETSVSKIINAIEYGDVESLEALLNEDLCNVQCNKKGHRPMHIAISFGWKPVVERLCLYTSCDVNAKTEQHKVTPLNY